MNITTDSIVFWAVVYVVISLPAVIFLGTRKVDSFLNNISVMFVPGLLAWMPLALVAATIYFWLYPERHRTTIDVHGTEAEKAALEAFRSALASETVWHRLMVKLGRRQPTAERLRAEAAIHEVWDRYNERMEPKDHSFKIKRIGNQLTLQYEDKSGLVKVLIKESRASGDDGYLIWEQTFCCEPARRTLILDRFATWASNRQIAFTVLRDEAVDQQNAGG
jgi:hypothetical protein